MRETAYIDTEACPMAERQGLLALAAQTFPRLQLRPRAWVAAAYCAPFARDEVEPQGPEAAEASQR